MSIGALIKAQRTRRGLTQTDVARRTGLSQNYVSKLEGGAIDLPQRATLEVLGEVLGITLAEFYRAAGVLDAEQPPDADTKLPLLADVMRVIESDPEIMAEIADIKATHTPETWRRFVEALAIAWRSNARMQLATWEVAMDAVREAEEEATTIK